MSAPYVRPLTRQAWRRLWHAPEPSLLRLPSSGALTFVDIEAVEIACTWSGPEVVERAIRRYPVAWDARMAWGECGE